MRYNKRYAINVFPTKGDCLIYDYAEKKTLDEGLFPDVAAAKRFLRNNLKQRPCKVEE